MRVGANTTLYLHTDHLGSTSATTNSAGASTSSQLYYPFGNVRATTGTLPTDFTFTGQRRDASAGLMYYDARYYDVTLGRFTQADTLVPSAMDPQSFNRYSYVNNNPVRYTDPTGHMLDEPPTGTNNGNSDGLSDDDTPYCEKYPYATGCYPLPADTPGDQLPNLDVHGDAGSKHVNGDADSRVGDGSGEERQISDYEFWLRLYQSERLDNYPPRRSVFGFPFREKIYLSGTRYNVADYALNVTVTHTPGATVISFNKETWNSNVQGFLERKVAVTLPNAYQAFECNALTEQVQSQVCYTLKELQNSYANE